MPFKIEHRIGVQVPADTIWTVLSDLSQWGAWSAIYSEASGRLLIGERLTLTEQMPGLPPRRFTSTIVDWVPNAQIIWQETAMSGLVRTARYIEIEALSETGCIFSNGQLFEGFGARFVSKAQRRALRSGFTRFGEALKARVTAPGERGPGA